LFAGEMRSAISSRQPVFTAARFDVPVDPLRVLERAA